MLGSLGHCGVDMLCSGHHLGDKSGTPVLVSLAQCGLTRDVWSGESPGSLWSYNLLVVITCHFFFSCVFLESACCYETSPFTQGNTGA